MVREVAATEMRRPERWFEPSVRSMWSVRRRPRRQKKSSAMGNLPIGFHFRPLTQNGSTKINLHSRIDVTRETTVRSRRRSRHDRESPARAPSVVRATIAHPSATPPLANARTLGADDVRHGRRVRARPSRTQLSRASRAHRPREPRARDRRRARARRLRRTRCRRRRAVERPHRVPPRPHRRRRRRRVDARALLHQPLRGVRGYHAGQRAHGPGPERPPAQVPEHVQLRQHVLHGRRPRTVRRGVDRVHRHPRRRRRPDHRRSVPRVPRRAPRRVFRHGPGQPIPPLRHRGQTRRGQRRDPHQERGTRRQRVGGGPGTERGSGW